MKKKQDLNPRIQLSPEALIPPGSGFVPKCHGWLAGRGAYGVVEKMKHKQTGTILAVKRITATVNSVEQRRLLMDLDISMRSSGRFVCATSLLVTVTRI
jgi:hypothetical protein